MPILPGQIPADRFANPVEGKQFGKLSIAEQLKKAQGKQRREELKEQAIFEALLRQKTEQCSLTFTHPRADRRTTIEVGHADFIIRAGGRCLALEFKAPGCSPSPAQQEFLRKEWAAGNPAAIVYSAAEANDILNLWLVREPLTLESLCPT